MLIGNKTAIFGTAFEHIVIQPIPRHYHVKVFAAFSVSCVVGTT